MNEEVRRVSIRAHFERFPATVKGAFVLRGADRDPHQVVIREARIAEAGRGDTHPIELSPVVLDVAPNRDLFVPFEFGVTELGAGWYGIEIDVDIDGTPETVRPGKRFPVAWPRASTRRGTVPIGRAVAAEGGAQVSLEQLDCSADSVRIAFSAEEDVDLRIYADEAPLPILDEEFDRESGKGRRTAYPVLKTQASLRVEVRLRGKPRSEPAVTDIRLP